MTIEMIPTGLPLTLTKGAIELALKRAEATEFEGDLRFHFIEAYRDRVVLAAEVRRLTDSKKDVAPDKTPADRVKAILESHKPISLTEANLLADAVVERAGYVNLLEWLRDVTVSDGVVVPKLAAVVRGMLLSIE